MNLKPTEIKLCGAWLEVNGVVEPDEVCRRIELLVSTDLALLGVAEGGWSKLYRDPSDGRLWELTYLHSEWDGGGPPCLTYMNREEASEKYEGVALRIGRPSTCRYHPSGVKKGVYSPYISVMILRSWKACEAGN